MTTEEKITNFIKERVNLRNAQLGNVQMTEGQNKNGEQLFYIRSLLLEEPFANTYKSEATYYFFTLTGEYAGSINTWVCNVNPPSQVEMEYWTNESLRNQGNVTVVAKEAIKDIFEDGIFDGLKVRRTFPMSHIESIVLSINPTNYPSLAVAKKLGFNDENKLNRSEYLESKNNKSIAKY